MKIVLAMSREMPLNTTMRWLASTPNKGTADAINLGHAFLSRRGGKATWMTWCSSDNFYRPHWLGELLAKADEHTGVVYGDYTWTKPGGRTFEVSRTYDPEYLIHNPQDCYLGPAFIIRSEVWKEAGEHRGKNAHDYGHWLRVEEVCRRNNLEIRRVDHSICDYNAHPDRTTEKRPGNVEDAKKHQAEAQERRRT